MSVRTQNAAPVAAEQEVAQVSKKVEREAALEAIETADNKMVAAKNRVETAKNKIVAAQNDIEKRKNSMSLLVHRNDRNKNQNHIKDLETLIEGLKTELLKAETSLAQECEEFKSLFINMNLQIALRCVGTFRSNGNRIRAVKVLNLILEGAENILTPTDDTANDIMKLAEHYNKYGIRIADRNSPKQWDDNLNEAIICAQKRTRELVKAVAYKVNSEFIAFEEIEFLKANPNPNKALLIALANAKLEAAHEKTTCDNLWLYLGIEAAKREIDKLWIELKPEYENKIYG